MHRPFRSLVALSALSAALLAASCGAESHETTDLPSPPSAGHSSAPSSARGVAVPDVVGMSEGHAVKALGAAGFVANVQYAADAPRTGEVLGSDPRTGSELPASSVVRLSVAYGPRLPIPTPEQEQLPAAFSRLIQDTPAAFFGLYRAEDGVPVVVFNPGVDPATWDDRLTAAATWIDHPAVDSGYRSNTCSRHWKSLRALQDEIVRTSNEWAAPPRRAAFGVWVQPETCTVRVESDVLLPSEIRTLVERYGTALSFDTSEGAAGSLLPLDSHPVRRRHAD